MVRFILLLLGGAALAADHASQIDRIFEQFNKPGSPGCAVGVLQNGETVHAKGYGYADLEHNIPLSAESRFYMASVSKQFTAAAAVMALNLDAPLGKYIPEIPSYAAQIPIRRLLDHTAGLRDFLTLWSLKGWSNNSVIQHAPTLALVLRQRALDFAPGTDYSYSNTGYFLISEIIHRVTGMNLDAYMQQKLFQPLGMRSTRFQHDHSFPVPNRAHGHMRADGSWRIVDVNFDVVGSGGLYSNVSDMLEWGRYFDDPNGARLLETLSTPGTLTNGMPTPTGYALGLRRATGNGLLSISHSGSASGYKTHFSHWPGEKLAVITLCNFDANAQRLSDQVASIFHGKPVPASTPGDERGQQRAVSEADRAALAGAYYNDELDTVWRLVDRAGAMFLDYDGSPIRVYEGGDGTFRVRSATLTPHRNSDGKIGSFTVSAGRVHGLTFSRR
jgi:CubicO group peptidase (beta-lactamase class C family)